MKRVAAIFVICPLLLSAGFAQGMRMGNPPPQGYPPEMGRRGQEIRKQLEQIKIWQMTREMNLPTDKAEKFFPLYNKYNDEMRSITAQRGQLVRDLDSAIDNKVGNEEIQGQIQHLVDLDKQLADSHARFIENMGKFLSPVEVAKYLVFEQQFDREIRDRIRMIMMQRMRGHNR
ncbi:MAG: hypothetical protein M1469_06860 [Bacteroidetes bacterium]|nr:hypothetical protein [Bacteroidota bacterium]